MMQEYVKEAFLLALEHVGIDLRYHDPTSQTSWDIRGIPQDTEWESIGGFSAADTGRVRAWLLLRDVLPVLPEPGHLVTEISPPAPAGLEIGTARQTTYVLAPLVGDRAYDILPEGVLVRITGKLHADDPLG